ncbi:uncharacterized protein [Panulirus ornatus]|uniref:uncharacterized protein isoform X2 n=1 Tax=Panulirus ornatus TaxID=150431 RepID=UPI003A836778
MRLLEATYFALWLRAVACHRARTPSINQLLQLEMAGAFAPTMVESGALPSPPPTPPPTLPKGLRDPAPPTLDGEMIMRDCDDGDSVGEGETCPSTHDGITCWPATPLGTYASVPCPPAFLLTNSSNQASRYCGLGGLWEPEPTDYLPCTTDNILIKEEDLATGNGSLLDVNGGGGGGGGGASASSLLETVIAARYQQCLAMMRNLPRPTDGRTFCPSTFDGWSCWNDTPAGETTYSPCPYFITGFDHKRMAHKACNEDGTWFRHPETNLTWSNYTTCIDLEDLMMRRLINTIYIAGYSVSLIALAVSLLIFFYFRSLQCTRIRLHKNLFLSFILNNILWIAWYLEVADKPETVFDNDTGCQVLHILLHYFLVSSYYWMFSEGLYLHTLLVVAFVSEDRLMKWFYLLGWGAPALIVAVYAFVRGSSATDTQHCWIEESHYTLILSTPVCISILANLVFLVNIVRVLVTKLRANHFAAHHNGTRKAVRATLILIPLLGLHYVLMPFRPAPGSHGELVYQVIAALASSFQGFCVALLFCFCNSEVTIAMKKKWEQYLFNHDPRRFSLSTTCAFNINGSSGRGSVFFRKPYTIRRTLTLAHHRRGGAPGAGSSLWANTQSVVVENATTMMETMVENRSVVEEEDYFGSRESCVGGGEMEEEEETGGVATLVVEKPTTWGRHGDIVVESHSHRVVGGHKTVGEPSNIVALSPSLSTVLESGGGVVENGNNGALEGSSGGVLESTTGVRERSTVGDTCHRGGVRVLNNVGVMEERCYEVLELTPVHKSLR